MVVRVLSTWLPPYTGSIHDGSLSAFNLFLPLVPNESVVFMSWFYSDLTAKSMNLASVSGSAAALLR